MRALLPFVFLSLALPALAGDAVTVYRCTDARGKVTLRDTPCSAGQTQRTRDMLRPRDPPPRPLAPAVPTPPPAAAEQRVIVINTPRPLYECITPDGNRYTSETPEGNPRWVPLWTLGYPVLADTIIVQPGGAQVRYDDGRWSGYASTGSVQRVVTPTAAGYGAGSWVRDTCHALPQADVCARLRDRRSVLGRRIFNAQPTERARLQTEERSVVARIEADCR